MRCRKFMIIRLLIRRLYRMLDNGSELKVGFMTKIWPSLRKSLPMIKSVANSSPELIQTRRKMVQLWLTKSSKASSANPKNLSTKTPTANASKTNLLASPSTSSNGRASSSAKVSYTRLFHSNRLKHPVWSPRWTNASNFSISLNKT